MASKPYRERLLRYDAPRLIGLFSDAPQQGKSTVAEQLVWSYGYVRVPFASVLKDMTRPLLNAFGYYGEVADAMLYGSAKEVVIPEIGRSPRYLMQTLGTEWGRDTVKQSLWVDAAVAKIRTELDAGKRVVVDDLRFPNELTALLDNGAVIWKVIRGAAIQGTAPPHASEGALAGVQPHYALFNDRDLDSLRGLVRQKLER